MTEPHTIKDLFDKIEALEEYFKEYPNVLRENTLQELKEKLKGKQTYKIAIVANMSAGKSTLINALFGREILPSFTEATSDCIVEITSMPKIPKKAEVFFENKSLITLEEKDFKELKQYAQKDSKCKEDQHKGVERITLSYPFLHIQNEQESKQENIEILFIDTPGPNNQGEFANKHKNQTKTALNDVDMALFVFDYGQLDANLKPESDEQGLWHTIKERKEKDENFEVFFLLNKIDMAFGDNDKLMKDDKDYSREREKELTEKYWGRHEKDAIKKLTDAAEHHGIQNPQIFALSSYYELLRRMENGGQPLTGDEEDALESFQKKFRRRFDEKWEQECIDYTGFEKLEEAINQYIEKQVVGKILEKYSNKIKAILREESNAIERDIQTKQQPKEEAEQNIKNAKEFLQKELPPLQRKTQENIAKSKEEAKDQVESTITQWIKREFTNKTEEIMLKAVIFMHKSAEEIKNPAKRVEDSLRELSDKEKQDYLKEVTLRINKKIKQDSIRSATSEYISSLMENCKNNFLDIQTDIKRHYTSLNAQCNTSLQDLKSAIEKRLNQTLQVELEEQMQPIAIDYSEALNLSTSIPKSVLSYNFKEAQYKEVEKDWTIWKPWTIIWREKELRKVSDEEHTLTINPKELQQAIANTFIDRTKEFKAMEIKRHQDAISAFGSKTLQKAIREIGESKTQEIDKLEEKLQDAQSNLEKSQRQQKALTNTQEKMGFK